MVRRRPRFKPSFSLEDEALEPRLVLSTSGIAQGTVMQVAAPSAKKVATQTTLSIAAGTLGQPITFTAAVRAPASAGSPSGTVELVDHGNGVGSATLSPTATTGKFAYSQATGTVTPQPGGPAYFFGKHPVSAEFTPAGSFSKSVATRSFTVAQPRYTPLSDGVGYETVTPGTGPAIQSGQAANVLYTGYLKNGTIFDDSANHGGTPFHFTVGAGQVVPGFDEGTVGMQAGETRIISIPAAEGYGSTASGPIPANSTILFVVTLESIS